MEHNVLGEGQGAEKASVFTTDSWVIATPVYKMTKKPLSPRVFVDYIPKLKIPKFRKVTRQSMKITCSLA